MENGKYWKLIISVLVLVTMSLPVFSYAYSDKTTHPALTNETIDVFNHYYPNLNISDDERRFVLKGSEEEDDPIYRPVNHFYDPVYNVGLLNVNLSAKSWAQSTRAQAGFSNLAGIGVVKDYFSADSDYSWDRAVYEYTWGDKERGLEALGHNLHLIQDMAVPPHVRNDQHLIGLDDSPYELFTKKFDQSNIGNLSSNIILKNNKIVLENSLGDYFKALANLTNNNFFSKDTIFDNKYNDIEYQNKTPSYNFSWNFLVKNFEGEVYKIVEEKEIKTKEGLEKVYRINDERKEVLNSYWNILSKQAVLHGAGVIKLFFDEVEKERQTMALYNLNKSFAKKAGESIIGFGEKIASGLYSAVNSGVNLGSTRSDNLAIVRKDPVSRPLTPSSSEPKGQAEEQALPEEQPVEKPVEKAVDNRLVERGLEEEKPKNIPVEIIKTEETFPPEEKKPENEEESGSQNNINLSAMLSSAQIPPSGGGSPDPVSEKKEISTTTPSIEKINPPIITSPLNNQKFIENSVTFTGKASTTNIIYSDFSKATTTANQNEDWALILEDLEQGSSTISFFTSNQEQTGTSTQTSIDLFVDSRAPEVVLNIKECQNSISQTGCLLATTTVMINAEWSSDEDDFNHFVLNQNGTVSTTTATTTQISITDNQSYTFSVSAVDNMGNVSDAVIQVIEINSSPVVINEIAWAGTSSATANDEWIELYNNTDHEINLENWTLFSEDKIPYIPLSGSIPAKGYYLLERTDDTTISDIPADLIYTGALSNSGEHLFLALFENNATTTVDEILKVNYWNQKGSRTSYTTMERYDSNIVGTDWDNWSSSMDKLILNGKNVDGGDIFGTPKARNSVSYLISNKGALYSDKTLTKENSPYLIREYSFEVKEGVTLAIEEGVVIKFEPSSRNTLIVRGDIKTNGTSENPVVFTSFYDDEYGGDMNSDGLCEPANASSTSACPSVGNWKQILIEPTSKNSSFDHTIVRYGGYYRDGQLMKFKGMVTVDGTDISIKDSIFEKSKSRGVQLLNIGSSTEIVGNIFRDNNYERVVGSDYPFGLDSSGGSPLVKDNLFENNVYGAYINHSSAIIDSNVFNNNTKKAISSSGANTFLNNSGSNNGINGIIIRSNITSASSTNILKKNSLPYVLEGADVVVVASSTLKIEPGVTIKFDDRKFAVEGNLEINGSESEKILFTSISDNSDGTNVRGVDQPDTISTGRRKGVYFKSGSTSTIKNTEFRYFYHALDYKNSTIHLEDVVFKGNNWAVYADGDSIVQTAENIIFENNTSTSTIPLF